VPQTEFTIRRKVLTILGAKFHLYNASGELFGFCKQKAFKLKEDIRIYTDETMDEERLSIMARSIIDFGAAYDVVDSASGEKVGALRRKGMASIIRDEWSVLDENDLEIGLIREDSAWLAVVRRYVFNIIPQTFHLVDNDGYQLAEFRTHFNPFIHRLTVTIDEECQLHSYLVLAAGVLLVAIEGRQE